LREERDQAAAEERELADTLDAASRAA